MEKGTSLWGRREAVMLVVGTSPQPSFSHMPIFPPEQCGPQSLVEASNAVVPQQVTGQLGGSGSRSSWSLYRGLGTSLGGELSLSSQNLPLSSW